MHRRDAFVAALVDALERDRSPRAMRRAIIALQCELHVTASSAYAILVRTAAGLPLPQPREARVVEGVQPLTPTHTLAS